MTGPRSFDRNELGTDRPDELDHALTAAAWLDEAVDVTHVAPSAGFGDRVMAALTDEPAPSPAGFLAPVRRRGYVAGFVASFRQAWASVGGGGRPVLARASALAYVLAVVIAGTSLAGVATVGIAGALGILGPTATQTAAPNTLGPTTAPRPTELPSSISAPPATPGESEEPSESPDASDDHGGSGGGGAEPSDDHGDSSGPGSSGGDDGDHSGPGSSGSGSDDSGSGSGTPRPTGTPEPTETPD